MRLNSLNLKRKKINIVIVTQNAPLYLGKFLKILLDRLQGESCHVTGILALSPVFKKSWIEEVKCRFDLYGIVDFLKMSFHILAVKCLAALSQVNFLQGCYSVKNVILKYNLEELRFQDINGAEFSKWLSDKEIDVLVSIACPKIMKSELLERPDLMCINYHTGKLPEYRGRQPLFWALLNDEKEIGITIHEMAKNIDAGDILKQQVVPIQNCKSLHELYLKTLPTGATMMAEMLSELSKGDVSRKENSSTQSTYFSFPGKKDGKLFRASGKSYY